MDLDETETAPKNHAFLIAVAFVGIGVVVAILFTVYVLLWDGGAHT